MRWEESGDVLELVERARQLLTESEEHRGSADLQASVRHRGGAHWAACAATERLF